MTALAAEAPTFSRRRRAPGLLRPDVRRLTLVQTGGIGDLVHALPVAEAIRLARPDVELTWVVHPAPASLLSGHSAAHRVVEMPRRSGLDALETLRNALRGAPAELTVNMRIYLKSLWPTVLSGAAVRLGLPRTLVRDGIWMAHTHHLPDSPWKHWQDLYLDFLPVLGLSVPARLRWGLSLSSRETRAQRAFFPRADERPVVGVVVASSLPAKDWPEERLPGLLAVLTDRGYRILLVGGPGEREARIAAELAGESVEDARATTVRELLWRLDGLDLLVSPDTGPLHLARALGVPVVGLYGRSNPARSGPWRAFADLLIDRYTPEGEAPDPSATDARAGRMESIAVQDVVDAVDRAARVYGVRRARSRGWARRTALSGRH